jgi:hypothetical protein
VASQLLVLNSKLFFIFLFYSKRQKVKGLLLGLRSFHLLTSVLTEICLEKVTWETVQDVESEESCKLTS